MDIIMPLTSPECGHRLYTQCFKALESKLEKGDFRKVLARFFTPLSQSVLTGKRSNCQLLTENFLYCQPLQNVPVMKRDESCAGMFNKLKLMPALMRLSDPFNRVPGAEMQPCACEPEARRCELTQLTGLSGKVELKRNRVTFGSRVLYLNNDRMVCTEILQRRSLPQEDSGEVTHYLELQVYT